ncbi:TetR/AcrR family transcriptional regulator [Nocardia takedensis]|uniref:TetR/AcrR family transcriptional regulator n=1 Tax=Nocardia takedensis TaxID=259390 RepID=UPI003F77784A
MPKLWNETVDAHRRTVREAILDTTAQLVRQHGVTSVTMSQIAQHVGIGRATLYKYFSDVGAILESWHETQVNTHLHQLTSVVAETDASERLDTVLATYATILREPGRQHDPELGAVLHRSPHVVRAQQQLRRLLTDVIAEAAAAGTVRTDIAADELATYCLHALTAAAELPADTAVTHLVALTRAGMNP